MSNRIVKRRRDVAKRAPAALRADVERALGQGDVERAARLAENAVTAGHADPLMLNLAAWRREEAGDFAGAHALLTRALEQSPDDVLVMGSIGAVLRKESRYGEALAILDRVVRREPRHAAAWLERGYVLDDLRDDAAADDSYARALAIDPMLAPALGKRADGAAKRGDGNAGRALAERALAIDPLEPSATFALATIEIEARDATAAEARLTPLLAAARLKPEDRIRALTLLGDALDRQDRTDAAFDAWRKAQATFRTLHRDVLGPASGRPSHRSFVEAISAQVERTGPVDVLPPAPHVPGSADAHVFLLGYPRSGTTLVENVLAGAPRVVALEERETLADADAELLANDGAMPPLDALPGETLDRLRASYWARVRTMAGDVSGKTFVDMNPFNGSKLPIIARLFPHARIVIMRRDPRDVVLSCFRVNFTPSAATWTYSELEETARHHAAMMSLIALCQANLPLAYHELRYDRLVADFEPTVRALADFIGLEWTDAFRGFDKTAQRRGVRTASATQVRRGLYDGGGQWRRYQAQLAPALPILAPWVERLGFDA